MAVSEAFLRANITHGYTRRGCRPTEYKIWEAMLRRCSNKNDPAYPRYGGRGIIVCGRWKFGTENKTAFECFLEDMGKRPSKKHSLDREENNGNYEPDNCRWATSSEQACNRRNSEFFEFNGTVDVLKEICRKENVKYKAVWFRIKKLGWDIERAITTPNMRQRKCPHRV